MESQIWDVWGGGGEPSASFGGPRASCGRAVSVSQSPGCPFIPVLAKKPKKSNSGGKNWASEGSRAGPTSLGCSPQNTMGIIKVGKGRQCRRAGGYVLVARAFGALRKPWEENVMVQIDLLGANCSNPNLNLIARTRGCCGRGHNGAHQSSTPKRPIPWGMERDGGVLGVLGAQLWVLHLGKASAQLEGGQGTAAAKGKRGKGEFHTRSWVSSWFGAGTFRLHILGSPSFGARADTASCLNNSRHKI